MTCLNDLKRPTNKCCIVSNVAEVLVSIWRILKLTRHKIWSMVVWYDMKMQMLDKMTVVKKRKELLTLLDGDVFYDIWKWPRVMEQSFWHKPVGDVDVFKLLLFTIGNGCPPSFISEWIMLSQYWCFS